MSTLASPSPEAPSLERPAAGLPGVEGRSETVSLDEAAELPGVIGRSGEVSAESEVESPGSIEHKVGDMSSAEKERIRDLAVEAKKNIRRATIGRLGDTALLAATSETNNEGGWFRKARNKAKSMGGKASDALQNAAVTVREKLGFKSSLEKNSEIMKKTYGEMQAIGMHLAIAWHKHELSEGRNPTDEEVQAHGKMLAYYLINEYDEESSKVARGGAEGGIGSSASQVAANFVFGKEKKGEEVPKTKKGKIQAGLFQAARTTAIVGGAGILVGGAVAALPVKPGLLVGGAIGYLKAQRNKGDLDTSRAFDLSGEDISSIAGMTKRRELIEGSRSREDRNGEFGFVPSKAEEFLDPNGDGSNAELKKANDYAALYNAIGSTLVDGLSVITDKNRAEIHSRVEKAKVVTMTSMYALGGLAVNEIISKLGAGAGRLWEGAVEKTKDLIDGVNINTATPSAGIETPTIDAGSVSELGEGYSLGEVRGSGATIHTPEGDVSINLNAADGQGDPFNRGDGQLTSQEIAAQLERAAAGPTEAAVGDLPVAYDIEGNVLDVSDADIEAANTGEGAQEVYTADTQNAPAAEITNADLTAASEVAPATGEALLSPDGVSGGGLYTGETANGTDIDHNVQLLVNDIINPNGLGDGAIVNNLSSAEAVRMQESLFSIGGPGVFEGDRLVPGSLQVKPGAIIDEGMRIRFEEIFNQYQGKINRYGLAA